jgi:hypothetical protein
MSLCSASEVEYVREKELTIRIQRHEWIISKKQLNSSENIKIVHSKRRFVN